MDLTSLHIGDKVPHQDLEGLVADILKRAGLAHEHCANAAEGIVYGQLRGSTSHGIFHLPVYVKDLLSEAINPDPSFQVTGEDMASRTLDGDNGLGVLAGSKGMDLAVSAAEQFGIGACAVRSSNHFGLGAYYVQRATGRGVIGLAFSNAAPTMAPWGGVIPILGTNPVAMGFPLAGEAPIIIDMASSSVARAKLRKAAEAGEEIPDTWALDKYGRPTTDAEAAMAGTVQPFGGAKGYAISLTAELLCASLSGGTHGWNVRNLNDPETAPSGVSHFFMAIDSIKFGGNNIFSEHAAELASEIRGSQPATDGVQVRLPGDRAGSDEQDRRANGIPVDEKLIAAFRRAVERLD
jgi:LDH2 family malate/lactate/ureidoglycolate dehydrogenase